MGRLDEKNKCLRGELYSNKDPYLAKEHQNAINYCYKYNMLKAGQNKKKRKILKKLLAVIPKDIYIEPPFRCDFGLNITVGERFYSNYNLTILDCNKVTIGDNCLIGPNVSIITVNHPQNRIQRNSNLEYAYPIKIGNDVWIGANAVINPGVTIGDNVIIGSGSVVTKDIAPNSIAVGNPAKIIRKLMQ